jgi:hypothetical protein
MRTTKPTYFIFIQKNILKRIYDEPKKYPRVPTGCYDKSGIAFREKTVVVYLIKKFIVTTYRFIIKPVLVFMAVGKQQRASIYRRQIKNRHYYRKPNSVGDKAE